MKKRVLLFTCIVVFSMLFTTTYAKQPSTMLAATTEQTTNTYDYSTITFEKDNVVGKYIKIKGLSDGKKQKKINAILKADAKAIVNRYDTSQATTSFEVNVKGKYIKDTNLFIAVYTGYYNVLGNAYPTNFYYVSVIDVENAARVTYTDETEHANIKEAIRAGKFTCKTNDDELAAAQKEYIKGLSDDELESMLTNVNIRVKKKAVIVPDVFVYKTKNTIQLSIPTIHAIGDYIEISIKKSDLK